MTLVSGYRPCSVASMTSTDIKFTKPVTLRYDGNLAAVDATDAYVSAQSTYTVLSAHRVQSVTLSEVAPMPTSGTPNRTLTIETANGARILVELFGDTAEALTIITEVVK